MKRRTLLLSAAGLAGALVVGWGVAPPRSRLGKADLWSLKEGEDAPKGDGPEEWEPSQAEI